MTEVQLTKQDWLNLKTDMEKLIKESLMRLGAYQQNFKLALSKISEFEKSESDEALKAESEVLNAIA